jgi:hypothetical protein
MRFLVIPERGYRPSLIVDVVENASDQTVRAQFCNDLFGKGTSTGILFDAKTCVLLHDSFSDAGPQSFVVDAELSTEAVLARTGTVGSLEARVERWLTLLTERWHDALPTGDSGNPFITNVVPAASGASVRLVSAA